MTGVMRFAYYTHRFKGIFCTLPATFRHLAAMNASNDAKEDVPWSWMQL
jgi:hypothetical protein